MRVIVPLLLALVAAPLHADCGYFVPASLGGRVASADSTANNFSEYPETFIDLSRPARAHSEVTRIEFRMTAFSTTAFTVRFVAFKPSGTSYIARNVTPVQTIAPSASSFYSVSLSTALVFEAGDVLGATFYSGGGGELTSAAFPQPNGYLIFNSDAPAPGALLSRDAAVSTISSYILSMEAPLSLPCDQITGAELFIPAVGDITGTGGTHFTTDLTALFNAGGLSGIWPSRMTLRDRVGGSPRLASVSIPTEIGVSYHPDSLAALLGITPPYFGSLTISFADQTFYQGSAMSASARVVATTASCSGGETGTSVEGLSCGQIGREISIPFHVPANHRLNLGIASAMLNSCGVFVPATSVEVWINSGPHVTVTMTGQSTQVSDITGAGAAAFGGAGLTDGVIYVRVTDEGSRIAAYTSLLDNTSQDSSVATGIVLE